MRRQGRLRRSCDLQQDHIIFILDDFSAAAKHLNPLPFWKGSPGMVSITPVKGWSMTCSNLYVEVVTSSTLECDFIWIWRYCRHNDVRRKMRQPLIQCDLCPCKKGKSEDRNHTRRTPCEDKGRDWSNVSTSQRMSKIDNEPPGARENHEIDSSLIAFKRNLLTDTLILDF